MIIELRKFGFMMAGVLSLGFGLLLPLLLSKPIPVILWEISLFFLLFGWLKPAWLKPIYQIWMKIGHGLGWINTRIILGVIFFTLITPIGFIMRFFKQDPLYKCYDPNTISYRKNITRRPINHMERPF
jgi:hypothetical protein